MWLSSHIKSDIIALAFKPTCLACAHIQKNSNAPTTTLISYSCTPLLESELENLIIFNPTRLGTIVQTMLAGKDLSRAQVRISLAGPSVVEKIENEEQALLADPQLKNLVWESIQNYTGGITRELLFQYQLFALQNSLKLTCVTTSTCALMSAYQALYGSCTQEFALDAQLRENPEKLTTLCSNISCNCDPVLIAELIGLSIAEFTYENY